MQVIEQFIQGKVDATQCEDGIVVTDHFIAVIDGVSSKTPFTYQGQKTGRLAMERICQVIRELTPDASYNQLIQAVNQSYADFYEAVDFPYDPTRYGLQAMVATYSNYHRQVWLIGDCQVRMGKMVYTQPKRSDEVLEEMRSLVANIEMHETHQVPATYFGADDPARKVILPWIERATQFANDATNEWGYSVLDGQPVPLELMQIITVPPSTEVILATDGYPQILPTLNQSEQYLERMLTQDPHAIAAFKSTKGVQSGQQSFDDRAYIRFITGG